MAYLGAGVLQGLGVVIGGDLHCNFVAPLLFGTAAMYLLVCAGHWPCMSGSTSGTNLSQFFLS